MIVFKSMNDYQLFSYNVTPGIVILPVPCKQSEVTHYVVCNQSETGAFTQLAKFFELSEACRYAYCYESHDYDWFKTEIDIPWWTKND